MEKAIAQEASFSPSPHTIFFLSQILRSLVPPEIVNALVVFPFLPTSLYLPLIPLD